MVACALLFLHKTGVAETSLDPTTIDDLAESFYFNEIRKRTLHTRLCLALCDTVSDKDTLLNCGGIILSMGQITLFPTFAPTADDTTRTSLTKEIQLAMRSRKALFY